MSLECTQTTSNRFTSRAKLYRTNATLNEYLCYVSNMLSYLWQTIKWWIHTEANRAEQQTLGPKCTYIWCQKWWPTFLPPPPPPHHHHHHHHHQQQQPPPTTTPSPPPSPTPIFVHITSRIWPIPSKFWHIMACLQGHVMYYPCLGQIYPASKAPFHKHFCLICQFKEAIHFL